MQKKHYLSSHTSDSPNGAVWRSSSGSSAASGRFRRARRRQRGHASGAPWGTRTSINSRKRSNAGLPLSFR